MRESRMSEGESSQERFSLSYQLSRCFNGKNFLVELSYLSPKMRERGIWQVGEVNSYLVVFDVWLPREREEVLEVVKATGDAAGRLQNAIAFGL